MTLALTFSFDLVVLGAVTGLAYAVLAAGLVLVYRATRVINFAHGEIGAFGAALLGKLVLDVGWNWFLAFLLVLLIGGALGAAWELTVVRRLFDAPRLVLLVATIGIAQVMFVAQALLPGVDSVALYPTGIDRAANVGGVVLTGGHFLLLAFAPAVIVGLALFLGRTPLGRAVRAAADNPDAARLAGVSVRRVSTVVWMLAGVLATATFVLIGPVRGVVLGQASLALGPGLLLRALAAALVGRLVSLPLTLVGGLALGIIEAVLFVNISSGAVDFWLFVGVVVLVLVRGRAITGTSEGLGLTPASRPLPARLRALPWARRLPQLVVGLGLVVAVLAPIVFTGSSRQFLFARVLLFALIGVSVVVLTGWAGQLSLGQFAFVGVGSMVTVALVDRGMPFGVAVIYATAAGVLVALAVGLPALRIQGLFLAVTTLALAVVASSYLLTHDRLTGGSAVVFVPRGRWGFIDLADQRTYYYLCLVVLVAVVLAVGRLRRTGVGRSILAVRENDRAAAAFTISPAAAKLTSFGLAGGIAALAGALLAGLRVQFSPGAFGGEAAPFGVEESLRVVAMAIIGGLGSVSGAVLGALYVIGLPALLGDSSTVRLLTSGVGLLVLLLYLPGGLLQVVHRVRDLLLETLARRADSAATARAAVAVAQVSPEHEAPATVVAVSPVVPAARTSERAPPDRADGEYALVAEGITVRFGGLLALDDVTVTARSGEIVGLIGTNGAGKSTLMDVVSGFRRPVAGRVALLGEDVTGLPAHARAAVGAGRLFQDARLFSTLTVRECVQVALEARERSELVPSLLALPPSIRSEARKRREADELVSLLGLERYGDRIVAELSTGTRRIAELACLIGLGPRVILMDEPTAGVAQRETEAFGPLIRRIRAELDASVVLIEHDMPLVLSLSDRVYCLSAGRVIAEGPPEAVRADPAVTAAYLGTDERAIERSDALPQLASMVESSTIAPAQPSGNGRRRPLRAGAAAAGDDVRAGSR